MRVKVGPLELLVSVGFIPVGEWRFANGAIDFEVSVDAKGAQKILYAFVAGEKVLYIGKSKGRLGGRLSGYRRPGDRQSTNHRIKPKIEAILRAENKLEIYLFRPVEVMRYKEITIDIATGLEEPLIERISPAWNLVGQR